MSGRSDEFEKATVTGPTHRGHSDLAPTRQVIGGQCRRMQHLFRRSAENNVSAFASGSGAYIDNIVGVKHHVFVVFDHDDRVSGIAKTLERIDKSAVVALVKSDTRLVENIKHVDKLAPELCGKPYALALTARQRCRIAVERKIFETYVDHEPQPSAYLL